MIKHQQIVNDQCEASREHRADRNHFGCEIVSPVHIESHCKLQQYFRVPFVCAHENMLPIDPSL